MTVDFAITTPVQASLPAVDDSRPYYLTNYGRQYWISPEDRAMMRLTGGYEDPMNVIVDFSHQQGIYVVHLMGGPDGVPESRETWQWDDTLVQQDPYVIHFTPDNLRYRVAPLDRQVTLLQGPGVPEDRRWNFIPWIDSEMALHLRARDQVLLYEGTYTIE